MDWPPFFQDYPVGAGLMVGCVASLLYSIATGTPADFVFAALVIGAWVGYQLRRTEESTKIEEASR